MNNLNNLLQAIKYYCNSKSDLALMINGKWGSGKTHFLKNELTNFLEEDKELNKTVIYTSANGISSFSEIETQIIIKIYGLKNKGILNGINLASELILESLSESEKYKPAGNFLKTIKSTFKTTDNIRYTNKVIIIDDLERINFTKLPIDEFLGIINRLFTENNNISLILVCDESQLISKSQDSEFSNLNKQKYLTIKEKTIIRVLEFKNDIDILINDIFETSLKLPKLNIDINNFESKEEMLLYIKEILSFINEVNLRTIKFIFENLVWIIEKIGIEKFKKSYKQIILFIILICKSFKDGILRNKNLFEKRFEVEIYMAFTEKDFVPTNYFEAQNENSMQINSLDLINKTIKHYSHLYTPIWPIYDFVRTGYLMEDHLNNVIDKVIEDFDYLHPWNMELSRFCNFRELTYSELVNSFNKCLQYLLENKYSLSNIKKLTISYFRLIEMNIIISEIPSDELSTLIIKAIKFEELSIGNYFIEDEKNNFPKYLEKHSEFKLILDSIEEAYTNIVNKDIFYNQERLMKKLIENITYFNDIDFNNIFLVGSFPNIDELTKKYIINSPYASKFNIKFRDTWRFSKLLLNGESPTERMKPLMKSLNNCNTDNQLIKYYIIELEQFIEKKDLNLD